MGESRLALQVLLILLLVLAGTPGGAVAAPLEWTASNDPTRVVFQAIETRGESTRSATLYGDGRVEFWHEAPNIVVGLSVGRKAGEVRFRACWVAFI